MDGDQLEQAHVFACGVEQVLLGEGAQAVQPGPVAQAAYHLDHVGVAGQRPQRLELLRLCERRGSPVSSLTPTMSPSWYSVASSAGARSIRVSKGLL